MAAIPRLEQDVVLWEFPAAQLPEQVARVCAVHLKGGQADDVGRERVARRGRERFEFGQVLGGERERGAVLALLGEHRLELDA